MATKEVPKLKKLPAKIVKANIAILEDLFLEADIDTSWLDTNYFPHDAQLVDVAIATLARYGNDVLLSDILEAEELDHGSSYDYKVIRILTDIHALWVDIAAIVSRDDNLLPAPAKNVRDWKILMDHEIMKLVVSKGKLMSHRRSEFGWEDYDEKAAKSRPHIIAVFNLKEDHWGEFAGTFVSSNDSKSGFTCHVLYADGQFRDLRYEGELGEIMREITPKK